MQEKNSVGLCLLLSCMMTLTACSVKQPSSSLSNKASVTIAYEQQDKLPDTGSLEDILPNDDVWHWVNLALQNNPDIQQTWLTLQNAQLQAGSAFGNQLPELEAGFSGQRKENDNASIGNSYSGQLGLSWQVDLWGQLATSTQAAELDAHQQDYLYQAAKNSLAAQVMSSWLAMILQQQTWQTEKARLLTQETTEKLIQQQYRAGLNSLEDLDIVRATLAQSRATVIREKAQLEQLKRAFSTLVGQSADFTLPQQLPVAKTSLPLWPEQHLQKRPDLQAAYLSIEADEARARVAYKALLPSFTVNATLSSSSTTPRQALLTDPVWSLLGQLSAPLFNGNQLRNTLKQRELDVASQYQQFRSVLLQATEEVANALAQEKALLAQQEQLGIALSRQQTSLSQYQRKYRTGGATIMELLASQRATFDAELNLKNANFNLINNRITLALALGLGVPQ